MTNLLTQAGKRLKAAYTALKDEIDDFIDNLPKDDLPEGDGIPRIGLAADKLRNRLNLQREALNEKDNGTSKVSRTSASYLRTLISRANTLPEITQAWTLYEEVWEQRRAATSNLRVSTEHQEFRKQALQTGETLVHTIYSKIYSMVEEKGVSFKVPYETVLIVPFLNRLHTGGIDTPLPYIAAPRWGITQPWTWGGYGHELGHHIFRNVKGLSDELKVNLTHHLFAQGYGFPMISLWYNWLEEIFADLFGVLQFGEVYVKTQQYAALLSFPRSALRSLGPDQDPRNLLFKAYDFTHPVPFLRLDLSLQMLALSEMATPDSINELRNQWNEVFSGFNDDDARRNLFVRTFEIDVDAKRVSREKRVAFEALQKIGVGVLQLILEMKLDSLANQSVRTVFARDDLPSEIGISYTPPEDIRDIVDWAERHFDEIADDDLKGLRAISEGAINRFAPEMPLVAMRMDRYTAQPDDTIKKIAGKMYKDENKYELIRAANDLARGEKIEPGKEYMVPRFS